MLIEHAEFCPVLFLTLQLVNTKLQKAPVEREYLRQMHGQEKFDRQWELDRRATYSKVGRRCVLSW